VINRGLFLAVPPPLPLGAVSRKIRESLCGAVQTWLKSSGGMGELLVAMEMASRIITQSSVWNRIIIRFSKPQQWQKRWRAPDATVKGRKEAIPVE
jgi:hypothetical protein